MGAHLVVFDLDGNQKSYWNLLLLGEKFIDFKEVLFGLSFLLHETTGYFFILNHDIIYLNLHTISGLLLPFFPPSARVIILSFLLPHNLLINLRPHFVGLFFYGFV